VAEARRSLEIYFHFYTTGRIHESLGYQTLQEVYYKDRRLRKTLQQLNQGRHLYTKFNPLFCLDNEKGLKVRYNIIYLKPA